MAAQVNEEWRLSSADETDPYAALVVSQGSRAVAKLWLDDAPVPDFNAKQRAYAARIVACLNACAGMSDESVKLATVKDLFVKTLRHQTQNRMLAEALRRLVEEKMSTTYHDCLDNGEGVCAWCEAARVLAEVSHD